MRSQIIQQTRFDTPQHGWTHAEAEPWIEHDTDGLILSAHADKAHTLRHPGLHTRNGDSIELRFRIPNQATRGRFRFGFDAAGHEHALAQLDFATNKLSLFTTDWRLPQPIESTDLSLNNSSTHTVLIEKTEGDGDLVKKANVQIYIDGKPCLDAPNLDILPEMSVIIEVNQGQVCVEEVIHRGVPSGVPESLNLGGWQMRNIESIESNLDSICRGLVQAVEQGVQLIVTPETSLTGLFPNSPVTNERGPIAGAERKLREFIRQLPQAPYLIAGFPVWKNVPEHRNIETRYNVSRVYDPDGEIVSTHAKVYSAEDNFWHGYELNEFDVCGVPTTLHICHDRRYPDLSTLPVMFGARLVLHPSNADIVSGTVDAFEGQASGSADALHAFYLHVDGGGGGYIAGPHRKAEPLAVCSECRRGNPSDPQVGKPEEGLFHTRLQMREAFGYWPTRAYRASEEIASAYSSLYRSMGGRRKHN